MQISTESFNKLQQLKAELESWRSQQTGRKHIPQHLWEKAFELLAAYSVSVLSRELRLSHNKLRSHLLAPNKIARKSSRPRAFLELEASDLINSTSQTTPLSDSIILSQAREACRILIERGDGSRLTLHLPTDWSKIEAICNGFLKG